MNGMPKRAAPTSTPGRVESLDYFNSVKKDTALLQICPVSYGQWQATKNEGPGVIVSAPQYAVNAAGFTANVVLPERKISIGTRYRWEYSARSAREGAALMMTAGLTF
jgi:hypothetical protein